MTYLPLFAYAAGIICMLGELTKPRVGRHRAVGLSTMELVAEAKLARLVDYRLEEPTTPMELVRSEIFGDEAPLCPPMYPPIGAREGYAHRLGAGRYAHLGTEELDTTNDRLIRLRGRRLGPAPEVDLQALRVRGAVPTVAEIDDEWLSELAPAGAR